ncbi:MAG: GNAT family N-acetyltransferase [Tepidiformaceae bacterium]
MSAEAGPRANPSPRDSLVVARSPRLRLRYKVPDDALDDYAWARDPETARFNGSPPRDQPFPAFLAEFEHEVAFGPPGRQPFAIETLDEVHIGNLMYYNANDTRDTAEFGMTIGTEAYRDRGYGREAAVAFLRFAWQTYPFRTMYLHTLEWNERARRSFAAAGFEPVARVQRGPGTFVRMEAHREWWLLHDIEGRFAFTSRGTRPT